jgi:hypothetical protein
VVRSRPSQRQAGALTAEHTERRSTSPTPLSCVVFEELDIDRRQLVGKPCCQPSDELLGEQVTITAVKMAIPLLDAIGETE